MKHEQGRIVRRAWFDWCLSAASGLTLVLTLFYLDARVQGLITARLIERPAEALSEGKEQVVSLVASAAGAATGYTTDNGPLVTFTVAGLVLLALMLFRRD